MQDSGQLEVMFDRAARPQDRTDATLPLLDRLPADQLAAIRPWLGRTTLLPGPVDSLGCQVILPDPGTVIALVGRMADGRAAELAAIGAEGAVTPALRARAGDAALLVQVPGGAALLPADRLAAAITIAPAFGEALRAHAADLLAASLHSIACATLHAVEQRVARWLLALAERAGRPDLPVTQESLATMLGVRRTTVTRVVTTLEQRGAIRHRRGRLRVLDGALLAGAACECHARLRAGRLVADPLG